MHRVFFVLAAVLTVPAFASTEPAHFEGALTADAPLRLQRAAAWLQEGEPGPDLSEQPVEQLTREQLQREYARLERERPGIGGPIALTSVGAGLLLGGLFCALIALETFIFTGTQAGYAVVGFVFLVTGAALAITGGVLLTVGLIKLFTRIGERRAFQQRMDDINARLETLDGANPPPAPPPPSELPPPPPAAGFFDVRPTTVLATF